MLKEFDFFYVDIFNLSSNYVAPVNLNAFINNIQVTFEVDTGAGMSCLPFNVYQQFFPEVELGPSNIIIKVYHGPVVTPKGQINVDFTVNKTTKRCTFLIVEGATKCLIGRDIWKQFSVDFK